VREVPSLRLNFDARRGRIVAAESYQALASPDSRFTSVNLCYTPNLPDDHSQRAFDYSNYTARAYHLEAQLNVKLSFHLLF